MSFRILCIETNPIARLGIESTFQELGYTPPKLVGGLQEATQFLENEHVDIIVLDVQVEQKLAIDYASELRKVAPYLKFVLWTRVENNLVLAQAVVHGFYDVIPRDIPAVKFAENIRAIAKGTRLESSLGKRYHECMTKADWPTLTVSTTPKSAPKAKSASKANLATRQRGGKSNTTVELTRREMHILAMLALGLNNNDIGVVLKIRLDTTKEHVQNLLRKLALPDRTAAAVWAASHANEILGIPPVQTEDVTASAVGSGAP